MHVEINTNAAFQSSWMTYNDPRSLHMHVEINTNAEIFNTFCAVLGLSRTASSWVLLKSSWAPGPSWGGLLTRMRLKAYAKLTRTRWAVFWWKALGRPPGGNSDTSKSMECAANTTRTDFRIHLETTLAAQACTNRYKRCIPVILDDIKWLIWS